MASIHKLLKKPFFGRFQKPWRWPEKADPRSWERTIIRSESGAQLAGLLGTATSGTARGAVVLAHPLGLPAKGFWLKHGHADLLRRNGFHVLAFDYNGFGESQSGTFDYPADVLAAGFYMRECYARVPLAVIGASFGAGWSICAMAHPDQPFQAAILESIFPTLPYYWRRFWLPYAVLRASQVVYPMLERKLRPISAAAQLHGDPRILLIFGERDALTPPSVGHQFRETMQRCARVDLWIAPGASHNVAYAAAPEAYSKRVLGLLDSASLPHVE